MGLPYFSILAFVLILASSALAQPAQPPKADSFRICYFSLNNAKEFQSMDSFVKKLNQLSPRKIEVVEYLDRSKNPEAENSFEAMVSTMTAKGERCNGLVISGHHTGSFGGARADGTLSIDFMEKLACDPLYSDWFNGISALWLQGCRTLGVGRIESFEDPAVSADYHTHRVGAVLEEDHLTQSFSQLNLEFSATLDQDNPLSSRYLRTFPRATVFGWTKTAPGVNAHSEYSIPYHIAHIAMLNDDRKNIFDNPLNEKLSLLSAGAFANALVSVLSDHSESRSSCGDTAVRGWISHGNVKSGLMGFNNPDLNAYQALLSTEDKQLWEARINDCILKAKNQPKAILETLDRILKNPVSIGYGFNSIYELMQRLSGNVTLEDLALRDQVQDKLKNNASLQEFLAQKLASPQLGLIRKIDYYAFFREMTGTPFASIERLIRSKALEQLAMQGKKADDRDLRDYQETLLKALDKHELADQEFLNQLLDSSQIGSHVLKRIPEVYSTADMDVRFAVLRRLLNHPKVDSSLLPAIVYHMPSEDERNSQHRMNLLTEIVNSPKVDADVLSRVASPARSKAETAHVIKLVLTAVAKDPTHLHRARWDPASAAIIAIGRSNLEPKEIMELLQRIITHSIPDNLVEIAFRLGNWPLEKGNRKDVLLALLHAPIRDESVTVAVLKYLSRQSQYDPRSVEPDPLLKEILSEPGTSIRILDRVLDSLFTRRAMLGNKLETVALLVSHPNMNKKVFLRAVNLFNPYGLVKFDHNEALQFLQVLRKSKLMDSDLEREIAEIEEMWKTY